MRYAVLIYQDEDAQNAFSEEELEHMLECHRGLQNQSKAAGHFVEANQLQKSGFATTVRRQDGNVIVTDGPFAETKEMLIGLYVLDCETLDEAIAYASRIAHADGTALEIRPIVYHETGGKVFDAGIGDGT